mmetsp:Transcript_51219/g.135318  ORF Transcript_51219/g.135318 Transcript_51219/m.135318 type:complete len:276 (+) Transcript_51219:563-1390(+)
MQRCGAGAGGEDDLGLPQNLGHSLPLPRAQLLPELRELGFRNPRNPGAVLALLAAPFQSVVDILLYVAAERGLLGGVDHVVHRVLVELSLDARGVAETHYGLAAAGGDALQQVVHGDVRGSRDEEPLLAVHGLQDVGHQGRGLPRARRAVDDDDVRGAERLHHRRPLRLVELVRLLGAEGAVDGVRPPAVLRLGLVEARLVGSLPPEAAGHEASCRAIHASRLEHVHCIAVPLHRHVRGHRGQGQLPAVQQLVRDVGVEHERDAIGPDTLHHGAR